jgi:ligand-binding sensor domain-containing protein
MEQYKKFLKIFFNIIAALLLICSTTSAAFSQNPNNIKFNQVFETGGYNFDIAQDKDGFIWVGTINGLKIFDGYDVKSYTASKDTFPTNNIRTIFVDSEGLVWLATFGGLAMFDKKKNAFTIFLENPDDPNSISSSVFNGSPNLIAESNDGLIWFGTANGLNSFNKKNQQFTRYLNDLEDQNSLSDNNILSVFNDRDGFIWIGTKEGGLNKFDPRKKIFTHYTHNPENPNKYSDIGSGEVNTIIEDIDGDLWIGTSKSGLKKFDKITETFIHYQNKPNDPNSLANDNVRVIVPTADGNLWICHPYWVAVGIERFDRNNGTFTQYKHDPNYPDSTISDSVQVAFEDASGILWIGENLSTISTYDKNFYRFNLYKPNPGNKNSVISNVIAIVEDSNKDIWLGSGTEGLAKYNRDRDNFTTYPLDPDYPDDKNLTAMAVEGSHNLWITTNNGMLGLFDTKTGKFLKRYNNSKLVEAWSILNDPENSDILWFGTENNGIYKFNKKTEKFKRYEFDDTNKSLLHILGIHADKQNILWFTNESNGLIKYDREKDTFKAYRHDEDDPKSISSNNVNYFFVSKTGTIWVSSQNGLNKFNKDTETFERYGEKAGFISNIRGILEDDNGFLWISSDSGLLKFDTKIEEVVRTYEDGGSKFNFSPLSVLKTTNSEMWFSSDIGVVKFNPEQITDNPKVPPVYFTSITQGGEKLKDSVAPEKIRKIELDWQHNFFEFEYVALNYTRSNENQYAYMLEGFDKAWHQAGSHRFGRYSGLHGGQYTLRVKGSNNDGVWNQEGSTLEIRVAIPWWRTHLFFGSVAILITFLIISIYLFRLRTIKTKNLELERGVKKKTQELQKALDDIKTLRGILPICARCKKIRDDKGYWNQIEGYIQKYSEAEFSHGMCPECSDELYGKEDWYIEMKKEEQQKE